MFSASLSKSCVYVIYEILYHRRLLNKGNIRLLRPLLAGLIAFVRGFNVLFFSVNSIPDLLLITEPSDCILFLICGRYA